VLPAGVRWELGGSHESSSEANAALAEKAPFGLGLLLLIILLEFNSLRRVAIVMATAPLAIIGIWPGLYLAGVSFGFVAQLGAIALVGLVINAALVILDVTERQRGLGYDVATALEYAVRLRLRPILLTVGTTVAGLAPLLFSQSTLWPPLAAAMMSGLTIGTALSIVVVPAMYKLLFRDEAIKSAPGTAIALPVAT
jgi:multidrug efflux pump subunit AcrB